MLPNFIFLYLSSTLFHLPQISSSMARTTKRLNKHPRAVVQTKEKSISFSHDSAEAGKCCKAAGSRRRSPKVGSSILFSIFPFVVVVRSLRCVLVDSATLSTRLPCPSLSLGVCSDSCPLSQWCCHPLLPSSLFALVFPSIRVFSNKSAFHIRWPKYWSFSFSISPSNEYSRLISFRVDWFDHLAVQGTFKSHLQHLNSKATIFKHSAFFMVQISYPHTTTGETIALTIWTFVSKVMSLLFNTLSRFVIAFLPRSKPVLISWLQSPRTVILELKKIKSITFSPFICYEMMEPDAMIFIFWMLSFKPTFSLSSFVLIKRLFSSSSLSAIRVVSSAYLRLLISLPAILIPACELFSLAFHMMYSA